MLSLIVSLVWKVALSLFFINLLVVNFLLYRLYTAPKPTITYNCPAACPVPTSISGGDPDPAGPDEAKLNVGIIAGKSRHVSYLPLLNSGSTPQNDWADLAGTDFYFDTADFPGYKEVYFEANLRLQNGNGLVFTRLYDVTHKAILWGSEIQAGGQQGILASSQKLIPNSGRNLLRVQAKSLTADTAIYTSGRLKIVSEY